MEARSVSAAAHRPAGHYGGGAVSLVRPGPAGLLGLSTCTVMRYNISDLSLTLFASRDDSAGKYKIQN